MLRRDPTEILRLDFLVQFFVIQKRLFLMFKKHFDFIITQQYVLLIAQKVYEEVLY